MAFNVFVAGDVVPSISQFACFEDAKDGLFKELYGYIADADISIANLEAPIVVDEQTPIKKSGPTLYTSRKTAEILKNCGFKVLTLANNHFYDQGQNGVNNTLDYCKQVGLDVVGGGKAFSQARQYLIKNCKGKRIAIINACEQEFSIANDCHGGSNPLDLINMQKDISNAKKESDYVLVIVHGGIEHYPYPTPRMKRWYRYFIDLGADVVINHHQHCTCGYEVYRGKPIFYGLGNFYFPPIHSEMKSNSWNQGYAVWLSLDEIINYSLIPYTQTLHGLSLVDPAKFREEIELKNIPIKDDYLLQQKLDEFVLKNEFALKYHLLPSFFRNRIISKLADKKLLGRVYKGKQLYEFKNRLKCESHLEVLTRMFEILTK